MDGVRAHSVDVSYLLPPTPVYLIWQCCCICSAVKFFVGDGPWPENLIYVKA